MVLNDAHSKEVLSSTFPVVVLSTVAAVLTVGSVVTVGCFAVTVGCLAMVLSK